MTNAASLLVAKELERQELVYSNCAFTAVHICFYNAPGNLPLHCPLVKNFGWWCSLLMRLHTDIVLAGVSLAWAKSLQSARC